MDAEEQKKLREKIALLVPAVFLGLCLIFFVPAGTLDYWEAWIFCAVLLVPFLFVLTCLLIKDPELLARRIRLNKKESAQRRIIGASGLIFFTGFLIPGLDHRYGWSDIPVEAVLAANVLVPNSAMLITMSYKSYAQIDVTSQYHPKHHLSFAED
jgi:hypothetical protein